MFLHSIAIVLRKRKYINTKEGYEESAAVELKSEKNFRLQQDSNP